jgi:hypothetical protein
MGIRKVTMFPCWSRSLNWQLTPRITPQYSGNIVDDGIEAIIIPEYIQLIPIIPFSD